MKYQLAIIGGGPAGYTAAEYAAKSGLSVVLFEREALGGVCLNEGCIPTKTLLYSTKLFHIAEGSKKYGITSSEAQCDYKKVVTRKNKVVRKLTAGIKMRMKEAGVEVIQGEALLQSNTPQETTIVCNEESYLAEKVLLCTGSETFVPPIPGVENAEFWTSREALENKEVPESLIIIGGGVIGMEFAGIFSTLGTQVTIVEMAPEILPGIDTEIAQQLRENYTKNGVEFHLSSRVTKVDTGAVEYTDAQGDHRIEGERILMCVGRRPVKTVCGDLPFTPYGAGIQVDEHMQTSIPNIYAAGDITGFSLLAHTAEREALVAINHIVGKEDKMTYHAIPGVVYTNPEIAGVGKTSDFSDEEKDQFQVLSLPMTYAGRFVAENEGGTGICKIVIDQNQVVVGCHMIGNPASEIITAATIAVQERFTVERFRNIVFPHPTVGEIIKETLFEI